MQLPIPKRLKAIRKMTGLSQRLFGIECEMELSYAAINMSRYENGKHAPSYELLCTISDKYNVPVSYFYERDDALADKILGLVQD